MHPANMAASDVAGALKFAYGSSANDAAVAMRTAGIATNDIAAGIESAYSLSVKDMASLLKNTFGVSQSTVQGVTGCRLCRQRHQQFLQRCQGLVR